MRVMKNPPLLIGDMTLEELREERARCSRERAAALQRYEFITAAEYKERIGKIDDRCQQPEMAG